ncbi:MAG TPA: hypothetical protein VGH19_05780 [Verrucomicrobiae bacterium]
MCLSINSSARAVEKRPKNDDLRMLKPNQVRIRLYADDEQVVRRISEHTRLSSTDVVSMILHAALRSIDENGGQFSLPLRFDISEQAATPPPRAKAKSKKARMS